MNTCLVCGLEVKEESDHIYGSITAGQSSSGFIYLHVGCYSTGVEYVKSEMNKIADNFDRTANKMGLSSLPAGNSVYTILWHSGDKKDYWTIEADSQGDRFVRKLDGPQGINSIIPKILIIFVIVIIAVFWIIWSITKKVFLTIIFGILVLAFLYFLIWFFDKLGDLKNHK
jgi:hypothetical protein